MATATLASPRQLQYETAFKKAHAIRLQRAELKRRIRRAEVLVVDVLADPPTYIATMSIGTLLESQWRWKGKQARKFLAPIPLNSDRKISELTERQRQVLIAQLPPQVFLDQKGHPPRSSPQNTAARLKGNRIRTKRAELKRAIKSGTTSIDAVLLDPPDYLDSLKLVELLLATPKFGKVKCRKLLLHCNLGAYRTIGSLTERQRLCLVDWLQSWAAKKAAEKSRAPD